MNTFLIRAGAFIGGALFGVGLALSGMTQPAKIIGFFDFGSSWDPSLGMVMLGAILIYLPAHRMVSRKLTKPVFADEFVLPKRETLDAPLLGGAALFGIGWGLGGYCPGPALTSVLALSTEAWIVAGAMIAGIALVHGYRALRQDGSATEQECF